MTAFVIIAAAMVAACLAWVLVPLLRRPRDSAVLREASNLAILQHQLSELETDRSAGTLSDAQYQQARAEIERRVLEEAAAPAPGIAPPPRRARWTAVAVGLALPTAAALLYLRVGGGPDALAPPTEGVDRQVTQEQIEGMVAGLAARLERDPNDARGWGVLARSYYVMQRFPDAARAYAKLAELTPDNADVLADYADALAMAQGRTISGAPLELARRALMIDPDQWKALALVASEAFGRKDYQTAVVYWERLQRVAPADPELAKVIAENIAEARGLAEGKATAAPVGEATVKGTVTLHMALAGRAAPSDTVFIYARAAAGPRVPLAVVKRQVKDLPASFTLDDSQAMMPNMRLSNFKEVIVGARISKSANATAQSGDLQGQSPPVKVGATNVAVVIDRVVP